ncbi:MAG: malto-oligosyltrehalose synthase [Candidatus Loosdrechtia sp.]|uniref:malto-oligosyltrehalose synthase n=1 Tax=Candidatus Loosdrechtia sp. TaxID=3101272 RepID=UPI003A6B5818|nr:MAG: malto-oligosyltrehalose synthase [Candidatus Jettenia sp. AMX2]
METEDILRARIPASTYRLQFNLHFRFLDAKKIIPYLNKMGISDIYASPYFKAKEGSLHGYDIVDHNTFNPEIGTEDEYNEMVQELWKYGMGQMLDIVPNHMCITSRENVWWMDVLENGPSSVYADFFDIRWEPVKKELKNKILLPVLGNQYGYVLEQQELRLTFEKGAFYIFYYDHKLPVMPNTYIDILEYRIGELEKRLSPDNFHFIELLSIITALNHLPSCTEKDPEKIAEKYREKEIIKKRLLNLYTESTEISAFLDENVKLFNGMKGDSRSFDILDNLLNKQVYRLSHWSVATDEINYRRFFDINDLAAIRVENPDVYEETHRLLFRLIKEGKVTGLRVDHPDGLYNPLLYFQMLQRSCFLYKKLGLLKNTDDNPEIKTQIVKEYDNLVSSDQKIKPFFIISEKILIKGEKMPEDWPVFSTTGYVFVVSVNGIFIETANAKVFDNIYSRVVRLRYNFQELVYEKKKFIMDVFMSSEVNTLGHFLDELSEKNRHTRDFTLNSLICAIKETAAFFPVYRTYILPSGVTERDARYIEQAISKAKRKNPIVNESIYDFLKDVLLLNYPENFGDEDKREWVDFIMRFQQITGPVMAKGLEDTALYVYNRLVSLNEVGGSPDRFGTTLEAFHGQNIETSKLWPHELITTSTHDSKRSEDVRARINVLSEIPEEWKMYLMRWKRFNKKKKIVYEAQTVPDNNEEYLFYQTLIGAWPVEQMNQTEYGVFLKRIKDYMLKALREAKTNTSWKSPNAAYEDNVMNFIDAVMKDGHDNQFLKDFLIFLKKISRYGMYNSLSQTLLKITSPGIPDFYNGTEIWDYSLVDPDNRRPVDYDIRMRMLEELKEQESRIPIRELARELTTRKEDGKIKLYVIYKALNYRRQNRDLFEKGEYFPLTVAGEKSNAVCAFARQYNGKNIIAVAPRFFTRLISQPHMLPLGDEVWKDTSILMPFTGAGITYRNIFTGETVTTMEQQYPVLLLSRVFTNFPVALLEEIK